MLKIWDDGDFAVFHTRGDLGENHITSRKRCIAFLDLSEGASGGNINLVRQRLDGWHRNKVNELGV